MASIQCQKPEQTILVQTTAYYQQTTTTTVEASHHKTHTNNQSEHSFANRVKEMANSAKNLFNHHQGQGGAHNVHDSANNHVHKPTANSHGSIGTTGLNVEKKKKVNKVENGNGGHCMPRMHEQIEYMKKKMNKKDTKQCGGESNSSDSGSSSDSDNEMCNKKNKEKTV